MQFRVPPRVREDNPGPTIGKNTLKRDSLPSRRGFWEETWGNPDNHAFWTRVSPDVLEFIRSHSPATRPEILDLGCGLGRNSIAFAKAGYRVTAADLSKTAVAHLKAWAENLDLEIRTLVCSFADDVFHPESFDLALAVNVIYHATRDQVARALGHVRAWLKPGGVFFFTMPTRQDGKYGQGREVAPHTFELEPGHVHYNADEKDLDALLRGFEIRTKRKHEHWWDEDGVSRFSSRWIVLTEKTEREAP